MPNRTSHTGSELFIVDNSDDDWQVRRYLRDWCSLSERIDIASGYFEIGALLALDDHWQQVDHIRILMGEDVSLRSRDAFDQALNRATARLDDSIEREKGKRRLPPRPARPRRRPPRRRLHCRIYRRDKFHAKCYPSIQRNSSDRPATHPSDF